MMQATRSVGVRELKEHTTQILRQVRQRSVEVQITYRGQIIARLLPVRLTKSTLAQRSTVWTDLDELATEIGARWPAKVSAVDAVREGRREL
jgi:prevent-host-death family protein